MKRNLQILLITIGFLAGIIFSANFLFDLNFLWLIPIILIITSLFFVKSKIGYVLFLLLAICIGIFRYQTFVYFSSQNNISGYQDQKQSVTGNIKGDVYKDQYFNNVLILDNLSIDGKKIGGEVKVKTLFPNLKDGQKIIVRGKIKPTRGKAESQISFAKIEIINPDQPILVKIKSLFVTGVKRALPEPASSFMIGILIGARSSLPKNLQDYLSISGLSHIVAVSGYNLTIIIGFLDRRLKGHWRWGSLITSIWLIAGFVVLTGGSASIVRAGIMSVIFMIVRFYGRDIKVITAVSLTAIITCAYNPNYLISDLGWQLSFLALSGIVLFSPKIKAFLPKRMPNLLKEIVAVSLSAQLATFPLIAYKFGQVSIISPLANILIMPLIPVLMLFGFLAGILGILLSAYIVSLIFLPLAKFIELLLDLIKYLASFKISAVKISAVSIYSVVLMYSVLFLFALIRNKQEFLDSKKA
ncbi:MAG: ComEC/Rec2 family competence protein [bacterium]|nr:ComEC/Rec2 family competence protein [bacterium]